MMFTVTNGHGYSSQFGTVQEALAKVVDLLKHNQGLGLTMNGLFGADLMRKAAEHGILLTPWW